MQNAIESVFPYLFLFLFPGPAWIPIVFSAYAIGRKRWGIRLVLGFVGVEAVSLALSSFIYYDFMNMH